MDTLANKTFPELLELIQKQAALRKLNQYKQTVFQT
jgi:hypothetical protein